MFDTGRRTLIITTALACLAAASCKSEDKAAGEAKEEETEAMKDEAESPEAETERDSQDEDGEGADIAGEEVEYKAGDTTLKGYLAYDRSIEGERPGVLVVHEWWGHNDYVRQRARKLAEMGYTAFALDMYGDGKNTEHPADAKKFMTEVMSNLPEGVERFKAARALLEEHETTDAEKTAAIGYCFGGGIVLHMARTGMDLDGVASFHGTLATETPAEKGAVKAKILVLNGEADPFTSKDVEPFKKEMAEAEADMKFVSYPGAKHAFTNPAATEMGKKNELPLAYDEEADRKSWSELERFLKEIFESR